MTRTYKLTIEYDGTDFVGWQRHPTAGPFRQRSSVHFERSPREETGIVGAGRTDSGVHARGQVASFTTNSLI
jgi:tRNA pseudouridine38-40 synthase